jgi:arylsulfatase A-like enzyme
MRAGMMTGKYQHRFGYERNIAYDPHNKYMGLPVSEETIASRLSKAGYTTGILGKWHLGASKPFHPNKRGFDYFFGFLGGGHQYFEVDLTRPMGEGYFTALQRNGQPEDLSDYLTSVLSNEAVQFIDTNQQAPFFLFVSYNAPHTPMQAPEKRLAQFARITHPKRRAYAAMVSMLDEGVGQIVDKLKQLNLRERTLIFFLSDNGGPERANASMNDPLRGQKGDVYEGGIRVPFVVSWPRTLPSEAEYHHPVNSIDASCTALSLAGIDLQKAALDGVNLVPHLAGKKKSSPHEAIFWRKENGQAWAVRAGTLKLLQTKNGAPELYDLQSDLSEGNNLAASRPDDVTRLKQLYARWNADNKPPFFPGFREYHQVMDSKYRELQEAVRAAP